MKKFSVLLLAFCLAFGVAFSQTEDLQPTKLGKWERPADTKIPQVEKFLDATQAMYKEAMEIRAQYEAIDTAVVNVETVSAELGEESDALSQKRKEYDAVLERVKAQEDPASKMPDLAADAVSNIPKSLKAVSVTKAINSGKQALQLVIEENAALLKAVTQQITKLQTAPTKQ